MAVGLEEKSPVRGPPISTVGNDDKSELNSSGGGEKTRQSAGIWVWNL